MKKITLLILLLIFINTTVFATNVSTAELATAPHAVLIDMDLVKYFMKKMAIHRRIQQVPQKF